MTEVNEKRVITLLQNNRQKQLENFSTESVSDIDEITQRTLNPDLLPTWLKLYNEANGEKNFINFLDRVSKGQMLYRYISEITPAERKKNLTKMKNHLNAVYDLLKSDDWLFRNLSASINEKILFDHLGDRINNPFPDSIFHLFENNNFLDYFLKGIDDHLNYPELLKHSMLSRKQGESGLIVYYTNFLCDLTSRSFKSLCADEIADTAYLILLPEKIVSSAQVRMNFDNMNERNNKD